MMREQRMMANIAADVSEDSPGGRRRGCSKEDAVSFIIDRALFWGSTERLAAVEINERTAEALASRFMVENERRENEENLRLAGK